MIYGLERVTGGYWRSPTLEDARGRATARVAELVELMLLMSSSSSIRPALERVREPLRREKNISEKIFRKKVNKKILEKMTRKMTSKMAPKMTRKNDRKNSPYESSRRSKNHWKIIALWSIFYRFFCHFFGHFFGRKSSTSSKTKFSTLHKIATSKKSTSLDEKFDSIKPHIWGWGVKFLKKRPCGALFLPTCTTPPPVIIFLQRGLDRKKVPIRKFCEKGIPKSALFLIFSEIDPVS